MIFNNRHLSDKTKVVIREIQELNKRLESMGIDIQLFPMPGKDRIKALPYGGNPRQLRDWNEYHLAECKLELIEGNILATKKKLPKKKEDGK